MKLEKGVTLLRSWPFALAVDYALGGRPLDGQLGFLGGPSTAWPRTAAAAGRSGGPLCGADRDPGLPPNRAVTAPGAHVQPFPVVAGAGGSDELVGTGRRRQKRISAATKATASIT